MHDFASTFWSVTLPTAWQGQHEAECATFSGEKNIGALQISSSRKDGRVTDEDLRDFASELLANGAKTKTVHAGQFTGFTLTFGDEKTYWRQWFLRRDSLAVFVTYNCPIEHMHQEDASVHAIVESLRARV